MDERARHRSAPVMANSPREGMFRLVLAGGIALLVSLTSSPPEAGMAYVALGLAAIFGVLLISRRPEILLRERLAHTVLDSVLLGVLVADTGSEGSPFFPVYFLVALGIARIGDPSKVAVAAAAVVVSYLVAGGDSGLPSFLTAGLLVLFCTVAGFVGFEIGSLKEHGRNLSSALDTERERVEKAESLVGRFGSALKVLDLEGIIQWTAEAAHTVGGGAYAHVAALNGNHHRTIQEGDFDASPSWWHPSIQRLVLWSCREGDAVRSGEEIHGMEGFLAVPIGTPGSARWGAIVLGGGKFGDEEERALGLIAAGVAPALENADEAPGGLDQLSGLPNRASLLRVLQRELSSGRTLAVLAVGLNGFRFHNRIHGRAAGNDLIRRIGARLGSWQRAFRYGGDEFVVVLGGADETRTRQAALGAQQLVLNEMDGSGHSYVTAAVGYAFAGPGDEDPDSVLREALRALREARSRAEGIAGYHARTAEALEERPRAIEAARTFLEPLESRDPDIGHHLKAVSRLALRIGFKLSLSSDQLDAITLGALLHDVGKIGVPDGILQKPASLTDEEYGIIKRHPALGARMLAPVQELALAVPVVRHHHERFDGGGYPDGLRGEEIPLAARIVCVADAFDSMVRRRPYGYGISQEAALEEIERGSGTQFDPRVVRTLVELVWELTERRVDSAG